LYFHERAQSKCGSWDYFDHKPGGGDKKVLCNTYLLLLLEGDSWFSLVILLNNSQMFFWGDQLDVGNERLPW